MKRSRHPEAVNPANGRSVKITGMRAETGVYIGTDGKSQFSSPEDVMTWRRARETMGLLRAVLYFFNRKDLPQVK